MHLNWPLFFKVILVAIEFYKSKDVSTLPSKNIALAVALTKTFVSHVRFFFLFLCRVGCTISVSLQNPFPNIYPQIKFDIHAVTGAEFNANLSYVLAIKIVSTPLPYKIYGI